MEAGGIEPPIHVERNGNCDKSCDHCTECRAARALHSGGTGRQFLATNDADLQLIARVWPQLTEAVRTAIAMLVKANVSSVPQLESLVVERRSSWEDLGDATGS